MCGHNKCEELFILFNGTCHVVEIKGNGIFVIFVIQVGHISHHTQWLWTPLSDTYSAVHLTDGKLMIGVMTTVLTHLTCTYLHICAYYVRTYIPQVLVFWFGERSEREVCTHQWGKQGSLMCAQVTRQVPMLRLIAWEQGRKLVNTFLLHIIHILYWAMCILQYKLSINLHPGYNYNIHTYVNKHVPASITCTYVRTTDEYAPMHEHYNIHASV